MGRLVSKIEAAFARKRVQQVKVPEWDLVLYVFPITIGQLATINAEADPYRRIVRSLVVRAKDQEGRPLFDEDDFDKLVSHGVEAFGPDVVARVVREMQAADSAPEDAEKN